MTDPEPPVIGGPLLALRLARRAMELACVLSPASAFPVGPPLVAGARFVALQCGAAPRGSADQLGCPPFPADPKPEIVVRKGQGARGLGGGGRFACFTSTPPKIPCLLEKRVSLTRRFSRTLMGPGL